MEWQTYSEVGGVALPFLIGVNQGCLKMHTAAAAVTDSLQRTLLVITCTDGCFVCCQLKLATQAVHLANARTIQSCVVVYVYSCMHSVSIHFVLPIGDPARWIVEPIGVLQSNSCTRLKGAEATKQQQSKMEQRQTRGRRQICSVKVQEEEVGALLRNNFKMCQANSRAGEACHWACLKH
jgi:hypothetical protein